MFKYLFMWALICATAPFVCAQTSPVEAYNIDSLDIMLHEVTVVAKSVTTKTDCRVIIPPASKVQASTSGLDLLQKLAIPGILVNQLYGNIEMLSGGVLALYINGIPATDSQIATIDPKDIVRIEYHDSPGVKYGNADAVLDYITRKKDNGAALFIESMNCIGNGKFATIDEIAAQMHRGKSSWSVNAAYVQMKRDNWIRDYEEIWRYPDHEVTRTEHGLPVKVGMTMLNSDINYQYANGHADRFNARLSLGINDTPYKEEGDRHSLLTTSATQSVTEISEHTAEKTLQPSLALNYQHAFDKGGTVSLNLEGSWLNSKSDHTYSEKIADIALCDICSQAKGNKYGFFAEGIHETKLGPATLTSGLRHTQSHASNDYRLNQQPNVLTTGISQSESAIFAEYKLRIAYWGFVGGITAKRLAASQNDITVSKYAMLPNAGISYKPNSDIFMRYTFQMGRKLPQLAFMSDISQEIQPGMVRRGNPCIKSFSSATQMLALSYSNDYVNVNLSASYMNESKPVMNYVTYEDGIFVQTYRNQKYFRRLQSEAMIAANPLGNSLTLWVSPVFSRYFSRGENYNLVKNILRIHFGADASYKHFIFTASTMSGADNYMYGDEIITEKTMNMILAGYTGGNWTLQAGAFNIMKNYWMRTENFSPLTPFKSNAHCGRNTYFAVKLSINLNYGKRDEMPSNASCLDMDSGIVNGLK